MPPLSRSSAVDLAKIVAGDARLYEPGRLPVGTDLSEMDLLGLQSQLRAVDDLLPSRAAEHDAIYFAYSAKHLPATVAALKALDINTQPRYASGLINILSVLPDPKENPYLRTVLASEAPRGLGTIITRAYCDDKIQVLLPDGTGDILTFIIHTLFWSPYQWGDDGKGSIDAAERARLHEKLQALEDALPPRPPASPRGAVNTWYEIKRLNGLLHPLEHLEGPPGWYIMHTQWGLQRRIDPLDMCNVCMDNGEHVERCSRCKAVGYCGAKCQKKAWKAHKLRCFTPPPPV
ncbi:hypothetical protein PENSPDRAFT_586812 [Peniophora sp. CONT]|nr:hypothetical protein PENSPDRAFT_586812 [Peniophora sp. CONT]